MNDNGSEQAVQAPVDKSLEKKPIADERGNEVAILAPLHGWRSTIMEDQQLYPNEKFLALALSLYMSERQQTAWPSLTRLERDTGLSRSSVAKALRGLERHGYIVRDKGNPSRSTRYYPTFPRGSASHALVRETPPGSAPHAPEVSNEVSIEPLKVVPQGKSDSYEPPAAAVAFVELFARICAEANRLSVPPKGPAQFRAAERLLKNFPVDVLEKVIRYEILGGGFWSGHLKSVAYLAEKWDKVYADYKRNAPDQSNPYASLMPWEGR